jgi:hypothetical protein
MAVELINVGQVANDGTGDDLREAFVKINQNFEELDLRDDEQTSASNLGEIGEGVFAQKINYDLQFKRLVAGTDISLTADDNQIVIDANGGIKSLTVDADLESIVQNNDNASIGIKGGTGIETSVDGDSIVINNVSVTDLLSDPNPRLGATLDAQDNDIINVNTVSGINVQSLIYGIDIREIETKVNDLVIDFDFGGIQQNIDSIFEWLISSTDVDLGTVATPDPRTVDFGLIT